MAHRKALVAGAVLLAFLTIAIPATAANANGVERCDNSPSTLGKICVIPDGGSYEAQYWNSTNHATYVDFNLAVRGGSTYGDSGAFTTNPGDMRTYVFAINQAPACVQLLLYDRTGTYTRLATADTC